MDYYEKNIFGNPELPPIAKFVIFSETPRNPQPQNKIKSAVSNYVGRQRYYDFVEEWLDNPWIRVVMFGLENLGPYMIPSRINGVSLCKIPLVSGNGNVYREAKLIILMANSTIANPKPIIERALIDAVDGASYNAFILSSLNYPWIKVVVTGINNIGFRPYRMR